MIQKKEVPINESDVSSPELYKNDTWGSHFNKLRQDSPVDYCPNSPYGPYWSITRFKDIKAIELDHKTYSSDSDRGGIRIDKGIRYGFISSDPPRHTRERKTVVAASSPINLASYEVTIRNRTRKLLAELPLNEAFDWNEKVSSELAVMTLATLFDFPFEERRKLSFWSNVILGDLSAPDAMIKGEKERYEILIQMADTFKRIWHERISQEPKLDLISMMAHNNVTRELPEMHFIGNLALLIAGGYDTTKNSMSGGVLALSENPDQRVKLIENPKLIVSLIGEIFRYQTPIIHMCRTATCDVEFQGQLIREGDRLVLWYLSGNRDDSVIESPDNFIIDRRYPNKHLSFGAGIHHCIGERLATLQLRIMWEEILEQQLIIDVVGSPKRLYSNFIRGFSNLPVRIYHR